MSFPSARILLLALSSVITGTFAFASDPPAKKPDAGGARALTVAPTDRETGNAQSESKPRVLVTISKETTYITEPLRSDGYPDYSPP